MIVIILTAAHLQKGEKSACWKKSMFYIFTYEDKDSLSIYI